MNKFWNWMKCKKYGFRCMTKNGYIEHVDINPDSIPKSYSLQKLGLLKYMIEYISIHNNLYIPKNVKIISRLANICDSVDICGELKDIIKVLDKE